MAEPLTPIATPTVADTTPPSSQGTGSAQFSHHAAPISPPHTTANANGKRPLSMTDVNGEASSSHPTTRAGSIGPSTALGIDPAGEGKEAGIRAQVKTHASGYSWSKPEDEPGWLWRNKRAVEEADRAWGSVVGRDQKIAGRYADPFQMADEEAVALARGSTV